MKGIKVAEKIETVIGHFKEVNAEKVADYDVIVSGAPNHNGRPSRIMKKIVDRLAELNLEAKDVAVFGTYAGRIKTLDRAVKKLKNMVEKKLPTLNLFYFFM